MTVDIWNDHQETAAERAASAVRFTLVAVFWMALVAGPPIVGGVLGWMATRDGFRNNPVSSLLGALPAPQTPPLVTRQEVEAVGLDPRDVKAIISD